MANWNGLQLTNKGIALQAKVQAGTQLHITKLKLGSGVVPGGTDIKTLNDLIAPEQNLGIGGKEAVDDYCKISSTISNTGLEAGYYVRELGVFAQDPDDGEVLYAYTTDGAPDYLPAGGGSTVISQEFSVMIAVDDVDNIEVDIDPAALATMGYVQLQITEHNTDDDGNSVSYNRFARRFRKVMIAANCKHTPHECRHTTATNFNNKGANITSVKRILGHADKDVTTGVYTHKDIRQLKKAVDLL